MPSSSDKPYRVYRQRRRAKGDGWIPWENPGDRDSPQPKLRRNKLHRRLFRYVRRMAYLVLAAALVWGGVAYWSFRSAVADRNREVPADARRALSPTDGPALTTGRNILLIGSDHRPGEERGRSDSLMLIHMDAKARRYSMLSIPRDLHVRVRGYGREKINAAYSEGGPALAIRTVRDFTGADVHHYAEIDFDGFKEVVTALGGVCVENPKRLQSTSFDGRRWFFKRGHICLTGKRALAYARIRKNRLDPGESDLTRGQRQQAVMNAIADRIVSVNSVRHPNKIPKASVQPLTTDITAGEFIAFALGRSWARDENVLRCRLGGELGFVNGESVIIGDEDNRATVRMWLGKQRPLRPNIAENQFAPGCTRQR